VNPRACWIRGEIKDGDREDNRNDDTVPEIIGHPRVEEGFLIGFHFPIPRHMRYSWVMRILMGEVDGVILVF
jgi:hypothetical protein